MPEWEQYWLVARWLPPEEPLACKAHGARCLRDVNDEEGFVRAALAGFLPRLIGPSRSTIMSSHHMATKHPRGGILCRGRSGAAGAHAKTLLVDESMYRVGFRHAFAAAAYWSQDGAEGTRPPGIRLARIKPRGAADPEKHGPLQCRVVCRPSLRFPNDPVPSPFNRFRTGFTLRTSASAAAATG